ncbi:MAG: glycerate kinase type-2 family protein [Alphaproteobacteria bacterium]
MPARPIDLLKSMFQTAVNAALPGKIVAAHLPQPPKSPTGRTIIVGAGKASAAMAAALEAAWPGPVSGLVVTRYGHGASCRHIEIVEAAHPVPDAAGEKAARRILDLAQSLRADDLMIALISGGGSALLALPAPGVTLADKQQINQALLASNAPIDEINCVRKHLSAIKGGRLAVAAYPARTVTLAISDVAGDDPCVIASGPTVGDASTLADAREILTARKIEVGDVVARALRNAANETPTPNDQRLANAEFHLVATPQKSLEAAAQMARAAEVTPVILGDAIEGEARQIGADHARIALQIKRHDQPHRRPCVLISGGETTVTLRGSGRGGRNVEYLLGLASALGGAADIFALAGDTDGIDGVEEIAGAVVRPQTIENGAKAGHSLADALANNDGHGFFEAIGDQIITGPTLTNVNDFRAILIQ